MLLALQTVERESRDYSEQRGPIGHMNPYGALAAQAWDFARVYPGARHRSTAFGTLVTSEAPTGAANFLFVGSEHAESRFESDYWESHLLGFFGDSRSIPWEVHLRSTVAGEVARSLRLAYLSEEVIMVRPGGELPELTEPPVVRTVGTTTTLHAFRDVIARVFNYRDWAVALAFPSVPRPDSKVGSGTTTLFVAEGPQSDGRFVGTSAVTTFEDDRTAVISQVAVLPGPRYRGHGIGTALTLGAMNEAWRRGARSFVLRATEEGRGMYERLGFIQVAKFCVLSNRPPFFDRARNAATLRRMAVEET
jgi:N-acetylglutamate synthase-like GNAT family acetyltransferase